MLKLCDKTQICLRSGKLILADWFTLYNILEKVHCKYIILYFFMLQCFQMFAGNAGTVPGVSEKNCSVMDKLTALLRIIVRKVNIQF